MLREILADRARPPLDRLRALVHAFVASECEEAAMRIALADAAPLYRAAPEARAARQAGAGIVRTFIGATLPRRSDEECDRIAQLIGTTLNATGKRFSESPRTEAEIEAYANAMADMFCAYLKSLGAA